MTRSTSSTSERSGRSVLSGLLDLRPRIVAEPRATHAEDGAFSAVDVAGARGTGLTRIKDGMVTGFCTDALTATHGLTGR
jgi:hypothetical protein